MCYLINLLVLLEEHLSNNMEFFLLFFLTNNTIYLINFNQIHIHQ
jgi:hypothetical protein